jgi:hypothetical protein
LKGSNSVNLEAGFVLHDPIAPRIAGAVPRCIQPIGCEDHQELIADGITMAAKMVDRLEQQNKFGKVTPENVAYYCLQSLKSGRRAGGCSLVDVPGVQAQLNGHYHHRNIHITANANRNTFAPPHKAGEIPATLHLSPPWPHLALSHACLGPDSCPATRTLPPLLGNG